MARGAFWKRSMALGKVYLVGAGPGDPGLITVKGRRILERCDAILYDHLAPDALLSLAPAHAERLYVGKKKSAHEFSQEEICGMLIDRARRGLTVARLKGGDPFLFGRGGEEAEYLAAHGILFEVVPGVSSCLSAPLSAGIAVTHRDRASSVAIVTGHHADGNDARVDWSALSKVDTLVVLMGVHNAAHIAQHLMAAGRSADTPAAIVQMAFWPGERVVTATRGTIAEEVLRTKIEAPATLVIGEAVRLRDKLIHHQQHIGQHAGHDSSIHTVPVPDRHSGDALRLEEESCVVPASSQKEVLQ